jgi:hypothetical protein
MGIIIVSFLKFLQFLLFVFLIILKILLLYIHRIESIGVGIIVGFLVFNALGFSLPLSVACGCTVFVFLTLIQQNYIGFWVIGFLLSSVWTTIFGFFMISMVSRENAYLSMGICFITLIGFHWTAQSRRVFKGSQQTHHAYPRFNPVSSKSMGN